MTINKTKDEEAYTRMVEQPLSIDGDLPRPATEDVRATAPENATALLAGRFCVSIEIHDNLMRETIFEDGFNCEKPEVAIRALGLAIERLRETIS